MVWEFDTKFEYKGYRGAIAFYRVEDDTCWFTTQYRGKGSAVGWYCAYVEVKPEDIAKVLNSTRSYTGVNGNLSYMKRVLKGDVFKYMNQVRFPDGEMAKDGYIVIGWDYAHAWDTSYIHDETSVENDIKFVIDDIVG